MTDDDMKRILKHDKSNPKYKEAFNQYLYNHIVFLENLKKINEEKRREQ